MRKLHSQSHRRHQTLPIWINYPKNNDGTGTVVILGLIMAAAIWLSPPVEIFNADKGALEKTITKPAGLDQQIMLILPHLRVYEKFTVEESGTWIKVPLAKPIAFRHAEHHFLVTEVILIKQDEDIVMLLDNEYKPYLFRARPGLLNEIYRLALGTDKQQ